MLVTIPPNDLSKLSTLITCHHTIIIKLNPTSFPHHHRFLNTPHRDVIIRGAVGVTVSLCVYCALLEAIHIPSGRRRSGLLPSMAPVQETMPVTGAGCYRARGSETSQPRRSADPHLPRARIHAERRRQDRPTGGSDDEVPSLCLLKKARCHVKVVFQISQRSPAEE